MVWSQWFELTPGEVANETPTTCGVFCVARKGEPIAYGGGTSTTLLLGAAADRQRGIRAVLGELAAGARRDLEQERKEHGGLRFCFQGNLGDRAAEIHTALLNDFVRQYGERPRYNKER